MRVTNHSATQSAISAIADSRSKLDDVLNRVTSGRRVQIASDDPGAALGIMQSEAQLRAREQYRRNISGAQSRVALEDSVLERLGSTLTRARELAISQGTDTATLATRRTSANEVNQLLADAVQLAGTRLDNEYLFGGVNPESPPFSVDTSGAVFSFSQRVPAPVGSRAVEIAAGQRFTATHDAAQIFGDETSGSLAALERLASALNSGSGDAVRAAIADLDVAFDATQALVAESGARANQLQAVDETHSLLALNLTANVSSLRDVELEAVLTEMAGRQTAYQAAMAATARVAGLTLADYLR
jgi:flagellar hook-associated protein 3 FlgL